MLHESVLMLAVVSGSDRIAGWNQSESHVQQATQASFPRDETLPFAGPHRTRFRLVGMAVRIGRHTSHRIWLALFVTAMTVGIVTPSHATTGTVRVTVVKAGFVVGAGGGRGVLTFRHRNYPFIVQGLSLGLTTGASINKLVGRAENINEISDFAGTYSVIGAGAALVGGVGGVQLRNAKGVTITLQGFKGGVEASANVAKVVITLDQSRSTLD
jgi:hypothetical protein